MHIETTLIYIFIVRLIAFLFMIRFYKTEKNTYHLLLVQGWAIYTLSPVFRLFENQSDFLSTIAMITAVIGMYLIIAGVFYNFIHFSNKHLYFALLGITLLIIGIEIFNPYITPPLTFFIQGITLFATLIFVFYRRNSFFSIEGVASYWLFISLILSNFAIVIYIAEILTKNNFGELSTTGTLLSSFALCLFFIQREFVGREHQFEQSEERFQSLFNKAPLSYQSLDSNGCFLEVNQQWLDTLGYTQDEVINKNFIDFLSPEDQDKFMQGFPIFKETGSAHTEYTLIGKNKNPLSIAFDGKAEYSSDGSFKQTHCILKDITELKMYENELKKSQNRYKKITELSKDGFFIADSKDNILKSNNSLTKILGYSQEELLSMNLMEIIPPNRKTAVKAQINRIIDQESSLFKTKAIQADGSLIDIQLHITYSIDEEIFLGFVSDITKEETTQKALEESEKKYSSYVENAPDGIFVADNNRNYIEVNNAACIATGYSKKELLSMNTTDLILDGSKKDGLTHFDKLLVDGAANSAPVQYRKKDGSIGWWIVNAVKLSENRFLGIAKDVSNIIDSEKRLEQSTNRLENAQLIAHVGDWELDIKNNSIWASKEAYNIYGIEEGNGYLMLSDVQALVYKEFRQLLDERLSDLVTNNIDYNIEFKIKKKNTGKDCFIHSIAFLEKDEVGNPAKVIGTIQDITEQKEKEELLQYLSYHDQLTGLYNRRFFEEEMLRLDTSRSIPFSIVLCDVNGLKLINDSFGHIVGDELLKKAASSIKSCCRSEDLLARHGGDEFVLLLPNTNNHQTETIIQRIKDKIKMEKVQDITISLAIGYDVKLNKEEDIQAIFKSAENNMYRQKLYESGSRKSKTIDLIINTLYEKNHREMLHSKRVSKLCEEIAIALKMTPDDINQIRLAGLMHDIGKIGINENILNKREALTKEEWEEIKKHSEIGYRILSSVNEFSEISEFVLEHQEKWDGSGYPKGLKGEEISTEARIIALADAYDAMTGERTYKKSLAKEETIAEIRRCSGTHFDPKIAKVFVEKVLLKSTQL